MADMSDDDFDRILGVIHPQSIEYKIPLSQLRTASLKVPRDLSYAEAYKIKRLVDALSDDWPPQSKLTLDGLLADGRSRLSDTSGAKPGGGA